MGLPWVRAFCLSLPCATEEVKWEKNFAFCIGTKMFAVMSLEPGANVLGFKCSPAACSELAERPVGFRRPIWLALEHAEALPRRASELLLGAAY